MHQIYYRKVLNTILILSLCVVSTYFFIGCNDSSKSDVKRGIKVSEEKLENIASGLTVTGWGKLRDGWAVKSNDFKNLYFIAAEIDGPGMEGNGEIGLWASNSLEPTQGLILSVDSFAKDFSVWPHGDTTDSNITSLDDGASEAKRCVREYQKN